MRKPFIKQRLLFSSMKLMLFHISLTLVCLNTSKANSLNKHKILIDYEGLVLMTF